ncbi:MAG: hypothetical protein WCC94_08385 [Candidatus Bathyarchaeia archaeon]
MRESVAVDFVKGHMGGNEIVLLHESQIPKRDRLKIVLSILDPPSVRGDQAVLLERPRRGGDIKVTVVDRASRDFISACGGMAQVLCRALLETGLGKHYRIRLPRKQLTIETDYGTVRVSIGGTRRRPVILADMTSFVEECYRLGVSSIQVAGVEATKVGRFLVADAEKAQEKHPDADFNTMNRSAVEILTEMQADYDRQRFSDARNADYSLYSMYSDDPTRGRVLFPHNIAGGHVEPSCGSGSVAIAIALAHAKRLRDGVSSLRFDSGGAPVLGGPDTTQVKVAIRDGRVMTAEVTHSLVEIVSIGKAWLPLSMSPR